MRAREFIIESIILEDPNQVRAMILDQLDRIKDEEDLVNILKFTNKFSYKQDVTGLSKVRDYRQNVSDAILNSIGNVDAPPEQIRAFITKLATDGIIKEKLLLTTGVIHSIDQIIDKKFLPIFDKIKLDLFEKISGKIGELGDVGKGEYLLAILSPRINRRGAPGDLDIDGTKVELKAGQSGRIGPAGTQSLAGRFEEFLGNCYKSKILEPGTKFNNVIEFNPSLTMTEFCAAFGNDPKRVAKALEIMLTMHLPGADISSIVKSAVKGGEIDGVALKAEMLAATFSLYQKAKKFDGIIIMDDKVTRYLYINTPETMKKVAPFLTVKWPSWKDKQSESMKVTMKISAKAGRSDDEDEEPDVMPTPIKAAPKAAAPPAAAPPVPPAAAAPAAAPVPAGTPEEPSPYSDQLGQFARPQSTLAPRTDSTWRQKFKRR